MRHIKAEPRTPRQFLRLTAEELLKMLEDAQPRDRMALSLGMNTALRATDLTAITIGQVNLTGDKAITAYQAKYRRVDEFAITTELEAEILRWLEHYAATTGQPSVAALPNNWQLIPAMHYVPYNVWIPTEGKTVYLPERQLRHPERIVHRALERLGFTPEQIKGEGFHTLRRSAAREIYELAKAAGVVDPITAPQQLLGHADRKTTQHYIGVTPEKEQLRALMAGQPFLTARLQQLREQQEEANRRTA